MTESIRHMYEKLKPWRDNDTLFLCGVMILVAVASFLLGRQSVVGREYIPPPDASVRLIATSTSPVLGGGIHTSSTSTPPGTVMEGPYVASKSGTKYHKVSCPGAAQIKEENKIFFDSPTAAEASGYTKAANCTW